VRLNKFEALAKPETGASQPQPLDANFFELVTVRGVVLPNPVNALKGLGISVASHIETVDTPAPSSILLFCTGIATFVFSGVRSSRTALFALGRPVTSLAGIIDKAG
jgi:hypothetical protein